MDGHHSLEGVRRRGFAHIHKEHGSGVKTYLSKRADCSSGGFYKSPTAGQSVNTTSDITISWDTSCLSVSAVDIYLYAPSAASPRLFEWTGIEFGKGSFSTGLDPKWWNNAQTIDLQLAIVETNTPAFLATMPAGPIFTAHSTNTPSSEQKSGMAKGAMAAAVLLPIIALAALIAGAWIKYSRKRGQQKRKDWSEAVDRRMSTISTDWSPITVSGASAAVRNSMAVGNRASSYSFGAVRPASTVADGGHAGIGARTVFPGGVHDGSQPPTSQLRPGIRASAFEERRSRAISFADQIRPSEESRRSRAMSRAMPNEVVPPLPIRQDLGDISPVQREGALTLTVDDIRARLSQVSTAPPRPSVDEVMPALSMMRQGGEGTDANDSLLSPTTMDMPTPPTPAYDASAGQLERSPITGIMPMQAMPAVVMSPDDLLRQYAEQRRAGTTPTSPVQGGMRVLYSPPATPVSAATPVAPRASMLRYSVHPSEEDPYGGTA